MSTKKAPGAGWKTGIVKKKPVLVKKKVPVKSKAEEENKNEDSQNTQETKPIEEKKETKTDPPKDVEIKKEETKSVEMKTEFKPVEVKKEEIKPVEVVAETKSEEVKKFEVKEEIVKPIEKKETKPIQVNEEIKPEIKTIKEETKPVQVKEEPKPVEVKKEEVVKKKDVTDKLKVGNKPRVRVSLKQAQIKLEEKKKEESPPPLPVSKLPDISPDLRSPDFSSPNFSSPSLSSPDLLSINSPAVAVEINFHKKDIIKIEEGERTPKLSLEKKISVKSMDTIKTKRVGSSNNLLSPLSPKGIKNNEPIRKNSIENLSSPKRKYSQEYSDRRGILDSLNKFNHIECSEENEFPCSFEDIISYGMNQGQFKRLEISYNFNENKIKQTKNIIKFYEEDILEFEELFKLKGQSKRIHHKKKQIKSSTDNEYSKDDIIYLNPLYDPYAKSEVELKQNASLDTVSEVLKNFEQFEIKQNEYEIDEFEDYFKKNNEIFLSFSSNQSSLENDEKLKISNEILNYLDDIIYHSYDEMNIRHELESIYFQSIIKSFKHSLSSSSISTLNSLEGFQYNNPTSSSNLLNQKKSSFFSSFRSSTKSLSSSQLSSSSPPTTNQKKKSSILGRMDVPYVIEEEINDNSLKVNTHSNIGLSRKQSVLQRPSGGIGGGGLSRKQSVLQRPSSSVSGGGIGIGSGVGLNKSKLNQRTGFKQINEPKNDGEEIPQFKPSKSEDPLIKMKEEIKYLKSIVKFLEFEEMDESFLKDRENLMEYDSFDLKNENSMNEIFMNPVFGDYINFDEYIVM
eukprot:gene9882-2204_t